MALKTLLSLFGSGKLPAEGWQLIEKEPKVFLEERLLGSITYRNFRSPRWYASWRRQWFLGSIVITNRRIMGFRFRRRLIHIAFDDARMKGLFSSPQPDVLLLNFDAGEFQPDSVGEVEIRFATPRAAEMIGYIESSIVRMAS